MFENVFFMIFVIITHGMTLSHAMSIQQFTAYYFFVAFK